MKILKNNSLYYTQKTPLDLPLELEFLYFFSKCNFHEISISKLDFVLQLAINELKISVRLVFTTVINILRF